MWVPAQDGMDHASLNPDAPPVNDAYFAISLQSRLMDIFLHQDCDIPRLKRMQIDRILDRQFHRFHRQSSIIHCKSLLILALFQAHF
jgi:hypothetical protein